MTHTCNAHTHTHTHTQVNEEMIYSCKSTYCMRGRLHEEEEEEDLEQEQEEVHIIYKYIAYI